MFVVRDKMFLNCHSFFSFKYGTMSPAQLLAEAKQKGASCLALTDINNTSGILDFFRLSEKAHIKPLAGIDFRNGVGQKFIGIAKNMEGFREMNAFLSHHLHSGEPIPDRAPRFENAFVIYPFSTNYFSLRENEFIGIKPADLLRLNFSDWKKYPNKLAALAPVTFRNKTDFNAHRLLRAIDNNTLLSKLPVTEQAQPDEIMFSEKELLHTYRDYPQLIYNTKNLLEQCEINFEFGKNKNLKYFTGRAKSDYDLLIKLCEDNFSYRYPQRNEKISERFKKEIDVIISQ